MGIGGLTTMATEQTCGARCWFAGQPLPTGSAFDMNAVITTLAASVIIGAGTGVFTGIETYTRNSKRGYCHHIAVPQVGQYDSVAMVHQPQMQIATIRKVFSATISDLAAAFDVSRQTVYNWINGKPMIESHLTQLENFASAANAVRDTGIPVAGWVLKRKIMNGKSLLDAVREGESAQVFIAQFVQIVRSDDEQRKRMNQRLAGKSGLVHAPDADFPAENDIES